MRWGKVYNILKFYRIITKITFIKSFKTFIRYGKDKKV